MISSTVNVPAIRTLIHKYITSETMRLFEGRADYEPTMTCCLGGLCSATVEGNDNITI